MKFRLLVLGVYALVVLVCSLPIARKRREDPPADMYLPDRLLALALGMLVVSVGALGYGFLVKMTAAPFVMAAAMLILGVAALLCWKNQKIRIVSEEEFAYTTFLGNTKTHRFDDILELRHNRDSMTLILREGKVHIESMAVLSEELCERIEEALSMEGE